ncbi:MAG: Gfo/Idh/MocA family oxidoreductase, partial [Anaerolineae bacterium]
LQWIVGMPLKIRGVCDIGKRHTIEVEDEVTAYMVYPDGCTGLFVTSTGEAPGTNRLEIAGDQGKVVMENDQIIYTRNEVPATEFLRTSQASFARPANEVIDVPYDGHGGQHAAVLENFADAILHGTPLIAPAEEGIHSVELANGMLYSSLMGRPIELPLDGAAYEVELKRLIANSTFAKEATSGGGAAESDMAASFSKS